MNKPQKPTRMVGSPSRLRTSALSQIRQTLHSMRGTAHKIGAQILKDPEQTAYTSINELALKSGVSVSAVVRFCRELGYSGYQEFRIALAQGVVDSVFLEMDEVSKGDSVDVITKKVAQEHLQTIQDAVSLLNSRDLQFAADAIRKASQISIHAAGPTYGVAWQAFTRFGRIGIQASAHMDLHTQMLVAGRLSPRDVALSISHTGQSLGTVEPQRAARAQGARTICVTGNAKSPLAKTSDIVLLAASHHGRSSRIAMMLVLEILFVLVTRDLDASDPRLSRSRISLNRLNKATMYLGRDEPQ